MSWARQRTWIASSPKGGSRLESNRPADSLSGVHGSQICGPEGLDLVVRISESGWPFQGSVQAAAFRTSPWRMQILATRGGAGGTSGTEVTGADESVSSKGWLAFAIGLSMALSSLPELRPAIGGATLHPYLLVVALSGAVLIGKPTTASIGVGGWGWVLILLILVPDLLITSALSAKLLAKWLAVAATFMVTGRLCQRQADFRMGAYGVALAVAFIAARGVALYGAGTEYEMNALPGVANRNAFAPWAGSAFAMAIPFILSKRIPKSHVVLLSACVLVAAIPIVLALSRGGWIILLAGAYPLVRRMSARSILLSALASLLIMRTIQQYQFQDRLENRYIDLRQGTASDERRRDLVAEGFDVFLANPMFGVGISRVPFHLADPVFGPTESHNLFIDFLAGTGVVGSAGLLFVAIRLLRNRKAAVQAGAGAKCGEAAVIVPLLLGLIVISGMTSNEVLYYPPIVFGLAAANSVLCASGRNAEQRRRASKQGDATIGVLSPRFPLAQQPASESRSLIQNQVAESW